LRYIIAKKVYFITNMSLFYIIRFLFAFYTNTFIASLTKSITINANYIFTIITWFKI